MTFSDEEKLREIAREIAMRRNVYPNWVQRGRITQQQADRHIAIMLEIAKDYGGHGDDDPDDESTWNTKRTHRFTVILETDDAAKLLTAAAQAQDAPWPICFAARQARRARQSDRRRDRRRLDLRRRRCPRCTAERADVSDRVDPLRVFTARADARALLAYVGMMEDVAEAINELLDEAFASGLLDEAGESVLNAIITAAFDKYFSNEAPPA